MRLYRTGDDTSTTVLVHMTDCFKGTGSATVYSITGADIWDVKYLIRHVMT